MEGDTGSDKVPEAIISLVHSFDFHLPAYKRGQYNEMQLRQEFIDPFFKALGWDVDNNKRYSELYKEVIHEDAIRIRGTTEFIDYSFRIGGTRKFIVEAKKPAVNIKDDPGPALQIRRYAWNARHDKMGTLAGRMLTLHKQRAEVKTDHEKNLIERQIEGTDKQIDALVYELYELTEEEIRIVEGSGK